MGPADDFRLRMEIRCEISRRERNAEYEFKRALRQADEEFCRSMRAVGHLRPGTYDFDMELHWAKKAHDRMIEEGFKRAAEALAGR